MAIDTLQSDSERRERLKDFIPPSPTSAYRVTIALTRDEVRKAQRLRYKVFNLELGEGLSSSEKSGLDADRFDEVCDHLLVEDVNREEIIGTYRLQTGVNAKVRIGYYSEQEFDFAPFESLRESTIELGRACIAKEHRNMVVLGLLWKGIAQYAKLNGSRYLIGCSSITSTNPLDGLAATEKLRKYMAPEHLLTHPKNGYICHAEVNEEEFRAAFSALEIPRLMRAYLTLGAKLCGEPALDLDFKTIDFLTLLDLESLGPRAMRKFLGD
ncbi:MAG: GNAT family N-acyltransferase [Verrucomicrobiota bacterium]